MHLQRSPKRGWVSLVAGTLDWHVEKVDSYPGLCPYARHFIMLASSVDRDVNGGPIGPKLTWSVILDIKPIIYFFFVFKKREMEIN